MSQDNYTYLRKKIARCRKKEDLYKIEKSADNLYNNSCLSLEELGKIDSLIMHKIALID